MSQQNNNFIYWNQLKSVPNDRLKTIQAGRLKGKSDINPQWRYEVLTQVFGICGIGWKYTIDRQWTEKYDNGEIACFVNISLFIKHEGEWSDAIPANGGSMFVANENRGPYVSDECFKMATTDALGTAAKMIGVASDVYQGLSGSKYENPREESQDNKPWLNKADFDKARDFLANGGDFEAIKKKYRISKEMMDNLTTVIKGL